MSGVLVVLIAVACDPSLLICVDLAPPPVAWVSVEACRRDANDIRAELALSRADEDVVMTQCRLYLPPPGQEQRFVLIPESGSEAIF